MKLSKEEIQKVVLGGLLAIGVIYGHFNFILGPLKKRQLTAAKEVESLDPKIAAAKSQIARTQNLKAQTPGSEATMKQVEGMIPDGSPVAWFPTLVGEHFKSMGVQRVTTRMVSSVTDPNVNGFRRISWAVDIPSINTLLFAQSLSDFVNQEPLVEPIALTIDFVREDPENQRVSLTLASTTKE